MKLHELINIRELEELLQEKYVSERKHPTLPLMILNYTPAATGMKEWTDTLSYCRGLVYDIENSEVLAVPFKKFWNYDDARHIKYLPAEVPTILEKLDGSYLNLFFYRNKPVVSTRGSFESEQALWAQKWVDENFDINQLAWVDIKYNYVFEVLIPTDKKVVEYDYSGLVLLGYTRTFDGAEFKPKTTLKWLKNHRLPREYDYVDLNILQAKDENNEEGYVAIWYNENAPAFRVKIKFETYKLLHRMYFQATAEVIWELTKNRQDVEEQLKGADPALIEWATDIRAKILRKYDDLLQTSREEFLSAMSDRSANWDLTVLEKERRKCFALYASKSRNPNLLFLLYDNKKDKYEEQLWKLAKPENSRFRDEGEE